MSYPISILLINRKNLEWLNQKMILAMRKQYGTKFTIFGSDDKKELFNNWIEDKDSIYGLDMIENEADKNLPNDINEIYSVARKYEKKYNVTYLRDSILQDRVFNSKFIYNGFKNAQIANKLTYENIINRQNYFFELIEQIFNKKKIDLVICRPDSLLGFAITSIAKHRDIPVTVQTSTRINNYMCWTYGAYMQDDQITSLIKEFKENNTNVEIDHSEVKISSHSFKDREQLINALSFRSLINMIIYILKDALNWLIKDIKRGKLGKRTSVYNRLKSKITTYKEHRYYQRIFENNINNIKINKYIYFPLPTEPEYNTHSLSKEFINTYAMIQQVAISMPSGYNLVIKEHTPNIGKKTRDFYTRLQKIPNLIIANYLIPGPLLVDNAEAIVTVAGSSAIEAAERGKMAVVFATSSDFLGLSNIILGHSMRDLPKALLKAVKQISLEKKNEIIYESKLLKLVYKKIGYYAPNTPLFHGKSTNITDIELKKAIDSLIIIWKLQRN
jgi:hypothetical protein